MAEIIELYPITARRRQFDNEVAAAAALREALLDIIADASDLEDARRMATEALDMSESRGSVNAGEINFGSA